ncbi:MAG: hypothetical protein ACRBK7_00445 [Acidimicrobiales bacterium]
MTDSYLAPASLAAARTRLQAMAGSESVQLTARPFETQGFKISASVDTVSADMVLWRWDRQSLEVLSKQLKPGTILVFLEPTAELGWRRVLHRYGRPVIRTLLRHHFETDVPAELRRAGLMVTTTIRFSTGPAGFRSYVLGRAEHITPAERHSSDQLG